MSADTANLAHSPSTDTVFAARDDARSRSGQVAEYMPYVPARTSPIPPKGIDPGQLTWAETVKPAGYTHRVLARGTRLQLRDIEGEACAHLLIFNADNLQERLNVADTLKIPWQAYITTGHPLLSGEGRVLATVVADTSGRHDAFAGTSTPALNQRRYGDSAVHESHADGLSLLRQGAIKHGLTRRDLPPSISFFKQIRVAADGGLEFDASSPVGAEVELIAEMDVLVLIANTTHPLDDRLDFTCSTLAVHAWRDRPTTPEDEFWNATPERTRAYLNTADLLEAKGIK